MRAIGFDLSIKATGIVVLEDTGEKSPKLLLEETLGFPDLSGLDAQVAIVTHCVERLHEWKPDKIVVEGYSLNMKNTASVIPLVELGGLFRHMLKLDGFKWMAPRAGELKKFVLGKGTGTKDQVQMYVLHRWGHMSQNNNTADAYALACMGLASVNKLPAITKEMRSVASGLKMLCN